VNSLPSLDSMELGLSCLERGNFCCLLCIFFLFLTLFFFFFSFQNEPEVLTPVVIQIPDRGTLYQWDESTHSIGSVIKNGDAVKDTALRVIYHTPEHDYSKDGEVYSSFKYVIRDSCVDSYEKKIDIYVTAVNDAPWPNGVSPVGDEDTPIVFPLSGYDIENDTLISVVDKTPFEINTMTGKEVKVGELYQYTPNFDPKNPEEPMKDGDSVTDSQKRVIYMPPADKNSARDTKDKFPAYYIHPQLTYHVVETETKELLRSVNDQTLSINIRAVNDAPLMWDSDSHWFPFVNHTLCHENCVFPEDWEAVWPHEFNSEMIWVGGHDIDNLRLQIIVTSLQCQRTQLIARDGTQVPIAKTQHTLLPDISIGRRRLESIFDIRPDYDNFGKDLCILTYILYDGELESESHTVKISFDPINDQPRMADNDEEDGELFTNNAFSDLKRFSSKSLRDQPEVTGDAGDDRWVSLKEATPYSFIVQGYDPEGDSFTIAVESCFEDKGYFTYTTSDGTETKIECGEDKKFPLPGKYTNDDKLTFTFYPPDDAVGGHFQEIVIDFDDGNEEGETIEHHIIFDVLDINDPPIITYAGVASTSHNVTLEGTTDSKLIISIDNITDSDIRYKQMEVELKSGWGEIKVSAIGSSESLEFKIREPSHILFYGLESEVRDTLRTLAYESEKTGEDLFSLRISDQGHTGKCPPDEEGVEAFPCIREAHFDAKIIMKHPKSLNTTAVAGGAVFGILILGIIVFGVMWRRFRTPPSNYVPWGFGMFISFFLFSFSHYFFFSFAEQEVSSIQSTLYEERGSMKGESLLYEGNQDKEMEETTYGFDDL